MDPKTATPPTPGNLDPKLKEMYDRIMAINVKPSAPAAGQTTNVVSEQTTAPQPARSTATPQAGIPETPFMPPANTMPVTQVAPPPPQVKVVQTQTIPTVAQAAAQKATGSPTSFVAQTKKKGSFSLMTPLLILGAIIFLGVYTFFWIKFFNLPVPFLPF